eukprot:353438-Chlamydomonas_euryale.AAC.5
MPGGGRALECGCEAGPPASRLLVPALMPACARTIALAARALIRRRRRAKPSTSNRPLLRSGNA